MTNAPDRGSAVAEATPTPGTEEHLTEAALRASFLRVLTQEERLLLILRHAEGMTDAEIASVLGVAEASVQPMYGRAVSKLTPGGPGTIAA